MAYVKVGSHTSATACLTYGLYKEGKLREDVVVSSVNCDAEHAKQEFKAVQMMWNKTDKIQAHTIIESYEAGTDPKLVNQLGRELAERVAPGHQCVVFTHLDGRGGKPHNHIIINAVNMETGKKLQSSKFLYRARNLSNEIGREHGLSTINEKTRTPGVHYTLAEEAIVNREQHPWKDEIREIVDDARKCCKSMAAVKDHLKKHGITVNERKLQSGAVTWTYQHPNGMKCRGHKLGGDYTYDGIRDRIRENQDLSLDQSSALEKIQAREQAELARAREIASREAERARETLQKLNTLAQETGKSHSRGGRSH